MPIKTFISSLTAHNASHKNATAIKRIENALRTHGNDIAISFSGAEDVLLVDLAAQTGLPYRIFSLDTGRLNPKTYQIFDEVNRRYKPIEFCFPDTQELTNLVNTKGTFSFFEDGHSQCCSIRKVNPLKKYLLGVDAWITGLRSDQSITRTDVPFIEEDSAFQGKNGTLIKYNPLSDMTSNDVWETIRENDVPYNPLHDMGYVSIGCAPCTRPLRPGQHEREARWWWEDSIMKECGLHPDKPGGPNVSI